MDEIDGLAPTRSADASQHKVDLLSVLLSMIDGVKNVRNLVLFGATNRIEMMDPAFLRRLEIKMFVGRPSFQSRGMWFKNIVSLPPDVQVKLPPLTLNFSNDAMKKLIDRLEVHLEPKVVHVLLGDKLSA